MKTAPVKPFCSRSGAPGMHWFGGGFLWGSTMYLQPRNRYGGVGRLSRSNSGKPSCVAPERWPTSIPGRFLCCRTGPSIAADHLSLLPPCVARGLGPYARPPCLDQATQVARGLRPSGCQRIWTGDAGRFFLRGGEG